jgi:hypothetical protein
MDHYFTASVFDKQGNIVSSRQSVPLANLQKLKYIDETNLPWIKNEISREEMETHNRFYGQSDKLFRNKNKPNLSEGKAIGIIVDKSKATKTCSQNISPFPQE